MSMEQSSFESQDVASLLPQEGVDDLIELVAVARANKAAHERYIAAIKAIKSVVPNVETRTRYKISDVAEIEATPQMRTGYVVESGTSVVKRLRLL